MVVIIGASVAVGNCWGGPIGAGIGMVVGGGTAVLTITCGPIAALNSARLMLPVPLLSIESNICSAARRCGDGALNEAGGDCGMGIGTVVMGGAEVMGGAVAIGGGAKLPLPNPTLFVGGTITLVGCIGGIGLFETGIWPYGNMLCPSQKRSNCYA